MLKQIIVLILFVFVGTMTYGQELKCKKFKTGTFMIPANDRVPESTLKRMDNVQVESLSETESMVLDIEWIDDCNYVLKRSKSTAAERISDIERKIDAEGGLRIKMLRTVKDTMFFRATATIDGKDYPLEGFQIKISKDHK